MEELVLLKLVEKDKLCKLLRSAFKIGFLTPLMVKIGLKVNLNKAKKLIDMLVLMGILEEYDSKEETIKCPCNICPLRKICGSINLTRTSATTQLSELLKPYKLRVEEYRRLCSEK